LTWTTGNSGTTADLADVTWTGSQFVAVGAAGTILTSPEGLTWSARDAGTGNDFQGVGFSSNRIVAVGIVVTAVSTDGTQWTSQPSGIDLEAVAWSPAAGRFVAVGLGGRIAVSPD